MPLAGSFSPVFPGELKSFSLDFAAQLALGETIASINSSTLVPANSWVNDPNASALLRGAPVLMGAVVSQLIGGGAGFLPDARYIWLVSITTSLGQKLVVDAYINVASVF